MDLPESIKSEAELEAFLTTPSELLISFVRTISNPLLVLGAGGKMGPTLAILAKRAAEQAGHALEVIAVSRFNDDSARRGLEERGVKTIRCDLLDPIEVRQLPDAENLIYLVGMKFGTANDPAATWAINTITPVRVAERFPGARVVALSTGNVYPRVPVTSGGAKENEPLTPLGEYANSAIGRERVFEFFSRRDHLRVAMLRLFYAVELRYGVLVDIAQKVRTGEPIDLTTGSINCIWQGDANDMIIRSLALAASPMAVRNLCAPQIFSVRDVAQRLGQLMNREPNFVGTESTTALLGNAAEISAELGTPSIGMDAMLPWIAQWVSAGGRNLAKPTHFETRDGKY